MAGRAGFAAPARGYIPQILRVFLFLALSLGAAAAAALPGTSAPTHIELAFYPQAGILGRDLHVVNYLDLDEGPGIRDWACGGQTYDGHTGIDSDIRSFREMDLGVPVFAALAGRVIQVQDGNYDRQYGRSTPPFDNHVVLEHGSGRFTIYGHLRRGIRLTRGQAVRRGQQLGWTASSGNSSWPHLHFTIIESERPQEPFAGDCRAGESWWLEQPGPAAEPYARDLALTDRPLTGKADLPHDQAARTGTFVRGTRFVRFRLDLGGAEGVRRLRVRFLRPDGSAALDQTRPIPFGTPHGRGYGRFAYRLALQPVGRWRLVLDVDGAQVADAPFSVVARRGRVRNRPPNPIAVSIAQPDGVFRCEIATSLVTEDPDYAIVRYRYRWTAGARVLRAVSSAALSDVLPEGSPAPGEQVTCAATPSDGLLAGPTASASATARSSD